MLDEVQRLPELLGRKRVRPDEVTRELVTGAWRRLVFENPDLGAGVADHRAYARNQFSWNGVQSEVRADHSEPSVPA